jgi:hypothetical protein
MPIFLSLNSQTSSINRLIAICKYSHTQKKDNMDNLLKHHLITRVKNESE